MKKTLVLLPILAGAILLGGCGNNASAPQTMGENPTMPNEAPNPGAGSKVDAVVGSLKDMVGMGKKMECVSAQDGVETKVFIEGKKYKSITTTTQGVMTSIFDGEAFYSWDENKNMPVKITMACMSEIGKNMPKTASGETGFDSVDKLIEEKSDQNCKEATEAVDFAVPTDISFVDQCAMMQDITKNMENVKLPKDINLPKGMPAQE